MSAKQVYTIFFIGIVVIVAGGFLAFQKREKVAIQPVLFLQAQEPQTIELKDGDAFTLTATAVEKEINGTRVRMLAYNNSIPGPFLKIPQDAIIYLTLVNNTDIPTTLHAHGVRMDNASDGVPKVTQDAILPGESFRYILKFPDAGVFWYHPHFREDYTQELGLYGNFLVTPSNLAYFSPVNREVPLILDDILMGEEGVVSFSSETATHTLMGRFGNTMLVNGQTEYRLDVSRGEVVRFYITNAANVRPFNFAIDGLQMKLVGSDGGAYEHATWKDAVLIGPSERAIIEVEFGEAKEYALLNRTPDKTYILGNIIAADETVASSYHKQFATQVRNELSILSFDFFRQFFDDAPDKNISFTLAMMGESSMMDSVEGHGGHMMGGGMMMGQGMMEPPKDGIEWEGSEGMMNAMSDANMVSWKIVDQDTEQENMDIDWRFPLGKPVKIRIFNDPKSMHPMQHPFHIHGQRFVVIARNGKTENNLVWKDTVFVRAGETVDIVVDMSNPGTWMAHCHIPEHLESGMMMGFTVSS